MNMCPAWCSALTRPSFWCYEWIGDGNAIYFALSALSALSIHEMKTTLSFNLLHISQTHRAQQHELHQGAVDGWSSRFEYWVSKSKCGGQKIDWSKDKMHKKYISTTFANLDFTEYSNHGYILGHQEDSKQRIHRYSWQLWCWWGCVCHWCHRQSRRCGRPRPCQELDVLRKASRGHESHKSKLPRFLASSVGFQLLRPRGTNQAPSNPRRTRMGFLIATIPVAALVDSSRFEIPILKASPAQNTKHVGHASSSTSSSHVLMFFSLLRTFVLSPHSTLVPLGKRTFPHPCHEDYCNASVSSPLIKVMETVWLTWDSGLFLRSSAERIWPSSSSLYWTV